MDELPEELQELFNVIQSFFYLQQEARKIVVAARNDTLYLDQINKMAKILDMD
jgi:hypothetical protein